MAEGEKIIGIDLGTTNSVVAVMEGVEPVVIPNQEGSRLTPSVVAFTPKGEVLVGEPAKRPAVTNPNGTIYSIKRFMGRRHTEVQSEEKMIPYEVVGGARISSKSASAARNTPPPRNLALILRKLKEAAEGYLGHKIRKAVITVPAYFNDGRARPPRTLAKSQGSKSHGSSTSPPRQLSPMAWTRRRTRRSLSSTSAAARSIFRSSTSATASSKSSRPTATPTSAATTGTRP